jgi:hypothetical protein
MKSPRIHTAGILILFCLIACTKVQTQSEVRSPGQLSPGENIVLLSNLKTTQNFDDDDVYNCLSSTMRSVNPGLNFVTAKQFRENLYPYFMPSTTPHTLESYKTILGKSEVEQRIKALKVRYLVVLLTSETVMDWHGGIFCGGGFGGGGCLGLSWWDRKSDFGFAIWDLHSKSLSASVQTKAAGTGIMPAFILPIPVYSPATESAACKEIGNRLSKVLGGQK